MWEIQCGLMKSIGVWDHMTLILKLDSIASLLHKLIGLLQKRKNEPHVDMCHGTVWQGP